MTRIRLKKVFDKRVEIDKEFKKKGVKLKAVEFISERHKTSPIKSIRDEQENEMQLQKKKLKEEILRKILEDEEERKLLEEQLAIIKREEVEIVNTINGNNLTERIMLQSLNKHDYDFNKFYDKP
jgi:hypothetical protein